MEKIISLLTLFSVFISSQTATLVHSNPKIICIDPGHGGDDPGAMNQELSEADVNLKIAKDLESLLQEEHFVVVLTREDNTTNPTNTNRAAICNKAKADLLVSIHVNASSDSTLDYTQGLYGIAEKDKAFTSLLHNKLRSELSISEPNEDAITDFSDNVLLKAHMPATLQETVFLTSDDEYEKLRDGTREQEIAHALAEGITAWFTRSQK